MTNDRPREERTVSFRPPRGGIWFVLEYPTERLARDGVASLRAGGWIACVGRSKEARDMADAR